jgi:glycosyltransferase involved in cell wall biosynthesis
VSAPAWIRVLHVLPHPGGGAETHIDLLERLPGTSHARVSLSTGRTPMQGALSIPRNWPRILRAARAADLVNVHGDLPSMLSVPMLRGGPSVWTTHGLHFSRRSHGLRGAIVDRALTAACRAADVTICTSVAEHDELLAMLGPVVAAAAAAPAAAPPSAAAPSSPAAAPSPTAAAPRLVDSPRSAEQSDQSWRREAGAAPRAVRLEVVYNAVDPPPPVDRAAVRAELGLAEAAVAILYLGQLEARKDPLLAVRAAAGIPGAVMLVAGEGPQEAELRAAGAQMLGFRRDPERVLAAADVLVMPSRHEGLSFAVIEAMAAGVACVVSDGPGNPEAVADAGIVFPAGDEAALRAALTRLASDAAERDRLAAAARTRAAETFSVDGFLARMGELYAAALSPH